MTHSDTSAIRILALAGNRYQQGHLRLLQRMLRLLADAGFSLCIQADFYDYLLETGVAFPAGTFKVTNLPPEAETVISVGGDGTFLHAAAWTGDSGIPVMGINTGHLGYLAHFSIDDMDSIATALKYRSLPRETRTLLAVSTDGPAPKTHYALNEVAILKDETSSMISVHTSIDNIFLADYRADGLIVSTATGSTGYSMSAGGPLLQPCMDAFVITPVAPHSLTLRPLVVSGDSHITALTHTRAGRYRVSVDGDSFTLPAGSTISIQKAPFSLTVLTPPQSDFAETLRRKLGWASSSI